MEDGNSHILFEAIEGEGKAFEYSYLCHLINDSLPPCIESELISVTKQNDKIFWLLFPRIQEKFNSGYMSLIPIPVTT